MKVAKKHLFRQGAIAFAVSLMFQPQVLLANPTGAQVVNGVVNITQPNASTLNVTNSPGAIINWQGFSIGAGEVTRFIQQSSSSAVLNRVVGQDISSIQGQLLSNGRVFLINPAGIIMGPNAMIDTAGFVGATLNMQNADFLAGKLRFSGDASSGTIINQGWIRTSYGGNVLLVAPRIENSGLIQTPGGELILAAGQKLTVSSLDHDGVQFEVQAPTDAVVNIGKLLADGGAVGVFAGTIKHSGDIRANALVRDAGGSIVLKASGDIEIAAGSTTSASGPSGGSITLQSANGLTHVASQVLATGSEGKGGGISILGERVTADGSARVDASGATGGGQILLGGDYQGANAAVQNATRTFVGSNAKLRADATQSGDGGRIIVWGNEATQFYGSLSAQGGALGGNGGFAEVSGKQNLIFDGVANLGAAKGALGTLLLDPLDLYVFTAGGIDGGAGSSKTSTIIDQVTDFPSNAVTVSPTTLAGIAGNVTLYASRYMRLSNDITLTRPGQSLSVTVGTYTAPALPDPTALDVNNTPNRLDLGANITTAGGAVTLNAPVIQSVATAKIATVNGAISLTSTVGAIAIQPSSGLGLSLDAGTALVTAAPATFLQLNAVTGSSFTPTAPGLISIGGPITTTGVVSLTSTGSSVSASGGITTIGSAVTLSGTSVTTGAITTGGGAVNLTGTSSSVSTGAITTGSGAVLMSGTSVSSGIIDTTSTVGLTATNGSVFSTVNNSSGVTAAATTISNVSTANVSINSTTALNATSITATANTPTCTTSCGGASINLTSSKDINVGTVSANAFATTSNVSVFNNAISRSVSVNSSGGNIFAASPAALIKATDITLSTQQGSGGGIGTVANALKVDTERTLNLTANGDFNVVAVGTGPTQLNAQLGVAPTLKTYTGTLTRSAGGLTLNASATDTTVTVANLTATGYSQRLYGQDPSITLSTPNGALNVTTVSVPEGDTTPSNFAIFPSYSTAALPVNISASGALTVNAYTRQSSGASLPKTTSFSSSNGSVTLGAIVASKDSVSISASGTGSSVAITKLSTAGNVTVNANSGDITVGNIDTTSGTGSVSLNASTATGTVKAQTNGVGVEVTSGGAISVSAKTIGNSAFANPLDLAAASITLSSTGATGGAIGFAGAPVIANTQSLTLNASPLTSTPTAIGAQFNVSTGPAALNTLNLTANPQAVSKGGLATVSSEGGKGVYTLVSDGTNFNFTAGTVPTTQFVGGALNVTSNSGDITLGAANIGATGGLSVTARNGSILGGASLDGGGAIALSAGQSTAGSAVAVTVGNVGAVNRPASLTINSGNNGFFTSRAGSVTTGNIEAGSVTINSFNGNMQLGNVGAVARAGGVNLTASPIGGIHGSVQTGNITAASVTISDDGNNITTGNLDATSSVAITSLKTITLGNVNAASLNVGSPSCAICDQPLITTGAITGVQNMSLSGEAVTINGSVTGGPAGTGTLSIRAGDAFFGGTGIINITGGSVTAGDGSTISLDALSATPLAFKSLNAGATGSVSINARGGIQQTAAGGITAKNVTLFAENAAAPINQVGGDGLLDLTGTQALTLRAGGPVALDANGSTLSALSITKTATPATAAFALSNLGGGQVVSLTGGANLALAVNSAATPLNFALDYSVASNAALAGKGINSGGGNVNLSINNGTFDGTVGGIVTGGATGGGAVNLFSSGLLTTGVVNTTPTGTGTGGAIVIQSSNGVLVNGGLRTGTGGGTIGLTAATITTSGGAQIVSDTSVSVAANAADIGAGAAPLLITSPNVTLSASNGLGGGSVFATLTNTKMLGLSGDNGFSVASNTAFDTLSVATRGTKAGAMTLTAPGQTYTFARPTTDLFGVAMPNTFQVVAAAGANATTFTALDGNLFVGGSNISVPTLTLNANVGNVILQGTKAAPVVLNNSTTQSINAQGTSGDILVRGAATLTSATQNFSANRSITVQAEKGTINISGVDQNIQSTGFGGGAISFKGGALTNETVTVSASNTQVIQSPNSTAAAGIQILGGDGAGSSSIVTYTGTGTQTIQGGGDVSVRGGAGANALAEIRTATGSQFVSSSKNLDITGGSGAGAAARIVNTGSGNQQVGESRRSFSFVFPYQTASLTVQAGTGADAIAEISAVGTQQVYVSGGVMNVLGGAGTNAFAQVQTASTGEQTIGCATYLGFCQNAISTLGLIGGSGVGSYAKITTPGFQRVTTNSGVSVTGSVADAFATLSGVGQDIRSGNVTLTAGAGNNANALVQSTGTQNIVGSPSLTGGGAAGATATAQITSTGNQTISGSGTSTMTGGVGNNSTARIFTGGNQTFNYGTLNLTGGAGTGALVEVVATGTQSLSGGALSLKGGGLAPGVPVGNSSATIQGNSQTINAGAIALSGGAGTAAGATSDAVLRNLSGNQSITGSSVTLTGGTQFSTAGILNPGAGTQTVSGSNGIVLNSGTGAGTNSTSVLIQNTPATQQTLSASFGGIGVFNNGAGVVSVLSAGDQQTSSRFMEVATTATIGSTGNAILSAVGNQWILTTNGAAGRAAPFAQPSPATPLVSLRVAALGTGRANIESGASQLIELDYPVQMQGAAVDGSMIVGDTAAAGVSRIGAVNQTVFAKSVLIQTGGPGAGTRSELKSSAKQVISTLNGNLRVLGGSGNNSLAQIDPTDQNILVNGGVDVIGGAGISALAQITSQGTQSLFATNGNINVTGGTGAGSNASITAASVQSLSASGAISATSIPGGGSGTIGGGAAPGTSPNTPGNSTATGTVLALSTTQSGVIDETEPGSQNENDPRRRAPICF